MKARINIDNSFGGVYTDEFLETNKDLVLNDCLVSDWNLTEILPEVHGLKLVFDKGVWIETATNEEILNHKNQLIDNEIEALKQSQISELGATRMIVSECQELQIDIPIEIQNERKAIRDKYKDLIDELINSK